MKHNNILRVYRIKNHYSQTEMANLLHVTQSSVSKFETGEQIPSIEILIAYCNIFHLTMDSMCGINSSNKLDELCEYLNKHSDHEIELMFDFLQAYTEIISKHIM